MSTTIADALEVFRRHWGHAKFRAYQEAVIEPALDGEDVIAVLPTGAGKSACFQVPALCAEGGAIVISPLISLMKDQVDGCVARGIPAGCIHSHMDDDDKIEALEDFKAGALKLLYVSPERLSTKSFLDSIQQATVSYIVVDEAHCCSEWGHQFRPDYMRINRLVKQLTGRGGERPPILALTATATALVLKDIKRSIGLDEEPQIHDRARNRGARLGYSHPTSSADRDRTSRNGGRGRLPGGPGPSPGRRCGGRGAAGLPPRLPDPAPLRNQQKRVDCANMRAGVRL